MVPKPSKMPVDPKACWMPKSWAKTAATVFFFYNQKAEKGHWIWDFCRQPTHTTNKETEVSSVLVPVWSICRNFWFWSNVGFLLLGAPGSFTSPGLAALRPLFFWGFGVLPHSWVSAAEKTGCSGVTSLHHSPQILSFPRPSWWQSSVTIYARYYYTTNSY